MQDNCDSTAVPKACGTITVSWRSDEVGLHRVTVLLADDGTAMGQADDNNDYGFSSPWTGLFSSGIATGTISGAGVMLNNQGAMGDVSGSFTLTKQ